MHDTIIIHEICDEKILIKMYDFASSLELLLVLQEIEK